MLSNLGPASVASFVDCEAVEVVAPAHPKNRFLMAYWRDRIQADGAALRRDILPADLKRILGGIFIVEPVDEGADMIHRLVGTENEHRLGMRCTGRRFTECYCPRIWQPSKSLSTMRFCANGSPDSCAGELSASTWSMRNSRRATCPCGPKGACCRYWAGCTIWPNRPDG